MKLLVGLGNPGPRYRHTRHNVGFIVLDRVAERLGVKAWREKFHGELAEASYGAEKVMLLKPMTYMNLSGTSVAAAAKNRTDDFERDVLAVVDDVNLPLGRLRLRSGGSAGGHNGLKSLAEHLGTQAFSRLRIGVGDTEAGQDLADHVLSKFRPDELPEVEKAVDRAAQAVLSFIERGLERTMNEFNG
ncbi:MAG: aminoacyl-tRNA hydrolase [FCB group bacterium]|nr:aminoacyl-tRNA hydrolase [FCB group bacterium]